MKRRLPRIQRPSFDPAIEARMIVFSRDYLVQKGAFGWKKGGIQQKKVLERKLNEYGNLTLQEFRTYSSAKLKIFSPSRSLSFPKSARNVISQEIMETLWRFRVDRKIRVLGCLQEHIFYIVWIDWSHDIK